MNRIKLRYEEDKKNYYKYYIDYWESGKIFTMEIDRKLYILIGKEINKINNIQELLDLTPKDIRDVAVYTYQELSEILNDNQ